MVDYQQEQYMFNVTTSKVHNCTRQEMAQSKMSCFLMSLSIVLLWTESLYSPQFLTLCMQITVQLQQERSKGVRVPANT